MGKKKKDAESPSLFDEEKPVVLPTEAATAEPKVEELPPLPPGIPGLPADLDPSWRAALEPETRKPYWAELAKFVTEERKAHTVFPPAPDVFNAFRYTPLDKVKVLLLGQDPYHGPGQAHGLCFSVRPGVTPPPSLRNIYKELETDLGIPPVKHGYLVTWAQRGVLMLNACMTVRKGAANSHAGKGWEKFTDAAIRAVNDQKRTVVFLLWGAYAGKKLPLIDQKRHVVVKSAHPSPFSEHLFFGTKPFSKINTALEAAGEEPIDWHLPKKVEE
ncbi:uracil-dna glycosylase : Uracil-DNA glycosylase OS=Deinococcus deserti (strain VCD115 / DSM 17065 / LMG 22923) GN=ung PE=3 SV=1: UDG [Gemmata massiliana]|uniref:Uracil-DNA glycosylase n=1 Tax=Gemmata massiliana TaxID=1210884 RepID=A0A6P2D279_9BACT|nr:uracil-DNA glycosylase [Gemmata massiliana]VTR93542.1 uracil-dna glycosylase : Uracil-DNA glycosylase OS=Deinococcus deserti (strain VCD115 / DSM 17065 / LMG 22923) GN=ung PE=3 SV=1: UDG [Gemmata massiliana]